MKALGVYRGLSVQRSLLRRGSGSKIRSSAIRRFGGLPLCLPRLRRFSATGSGTQAIRIFFEVATNKKNTLAGCFFTGSGSKIRTYDLSGMNRML